MNYSDKRKAVLVYSTDTYKASLLKSEKKHLKNNRKREKYFLRKTGILMTFGKTELGE